MQLDLKTVEVKQRRQTYSHLQRRFGEDRPASRYEEGTFDIQADVNFHYKPTWEEGKDLFDTSRTKVVMADWYKLTDPRQYYYATYNIARSKMNEAVDRNFDFVEKTNLLTSLPQETINKVKAVLIPLRHYEWGANMTNANCTFVGYGTAITQATCFAMADRLGLAQLISRIGLTLDDNDPVGLDTAKEAWLHDEKWQGLRHLVEDILVCEDWFETFVAQNLVMDALVHGLVYDGIISNLKDGSAVALLCEFVQEWRKETTRWVDHVVKVAAAESDENRALIVGWIESYSTRTSDALVHLADYGLGVEGQEALTNAKVALEKRCSKIGLV